MSQEGTEEVEATVVVVDGEEVAVADEDVAAGVEAEEEVDCYQISD